MNHSQNIQRTLESMFKKQTPDSGILRLNQGMQFDRPGSPFLVIGFMMLLTTSIMLIISGSFLIGLLILPFLIPLVAYIIDIQGIEVDFKQGKIRKYRSFLGLRMGEWLDLGAFDSVRVYQHQLKMKSSPLNKLRPRKFDTEAYYYVRLVSPGMNKSISLLELPEYGRAKYQAEMVAQHARLILIDKPARLKADKV